VSSGTLTPSSTNGQFQKYVNNGAHTLAPPATDTVMTLQVTNGATAGAITVSGFTWPTGTADLTTTNGDDFLIDVRKVNGFSHINVTKLQ
jgi:2-methylisocitrate lyase-like PEP mutase family enzyme